MMKLKSSAREIQPKRLLRALKCSINNWTKRWLETMPECFCAEPRKKMLSADRFWQSPVPLLHTQILKPKYKFKQKRKEEDTRHFLLAISRSSTSGRPM